MIWWILAGCTDKDNLTQDSGNDIDVVDSGSDSGVVDNDGDGWDASTDCDDSNSTIHPNADEVCDGVDNDCDGLVDADDPALSDGAAVYTDDDGDGVGAGDVLTTCDGSLKGLSQLDGDCDDTDARTYPGAWESCDGMDRDCDGLVDDCGLASAAVWVHGEADERLGLAMGSGDINGDGEGDLLVGGASDYDRVGTAWILYGPLSGQHSTLDADVVVAGGKSLAGFGTELSVVGDVNNDGYDDVLIGAPETEVWREQAWSNLEEGGAWLFLGPLSGTLSEADADASFSIASTIDEYLRVVGMQLGKSLDVVGDITGDGVADLLLSAPGYSGEYYPPGIICVVSGEATGEVDPYTDSGASCVEGWVGSYSSSMMGEEIAGVGDLNGDGVNEVAVGISSNVEVHYGPFSTGGTVSLWGEDNGTAGESVSNAGDVNNDGFDDIIIGDRSLDVSGVQNAGAAYVVYGPVSESSLSTHPVIYGNINNPSLGQVIASAGDIDHDGAGDIMIGLPGDEDGGTDAGAVWLVIGPVSGAHDVADVGEKIVGESGYLGFEVVPAQAPFAEQVWISAPLGSAGTAGGGDVYLLGQGL